MFLRHFRISPENAVGAALCGRPSVLRRGMFPRHPVGASPRLARPPVAGRFPVHLVGEGLAPPAMSREWPWIAVGAGPRPARRFFIRVSFLDEGFALRGDLLCPRRQRRQNAAGGGLRWASPPIVAPPPDPRLRGDTPTPFCKISGAQNMVPGMIPSRPLGPGAVQNFGWYGSTAAPGSDQPWQRVQIDGALVGIPPKIENGRVRRPAPTRQFRSWAMRWPPQPRNHACHSGTKRGC